MIGYNESRKAFEFPARKGGLRAYLVFCLLMVFTLGPMFGWLLYQEIMKYQASKTVNFVQFSPAWASIYLFGLIVTLVYFLSKIAQVRKELRVGKLLLHKKYIVTPDRAIAVKKVREIVLYSEVERKSLFSKKVVPNNRFVLLGEHDKLLGVIFLEDYLYENEEGELHPVQVHDVGDALKRMYPHVAWSAPTFKFKDSSEIK